jgi:hypothetical protein
VAVADPGKSQEPPTISSAGSFFGFYGRPHLGSAFLPTPYNPDTLVQRKGLKTYRTMLTDEQVKAALLAKKYAVLSNGYEIQLAQLPESKTQPGQPPAKPGEKKPPFGQPLSEESEEANGEEAGNEDELFSRRYLSPGQNGNGNKVSNGRDLGGNGFNAEPPFNGASGEGEQFLGGNGAEEPVEEEEEPRDPLLEAAEEHKEFIEFVFEEMKGSFNSKLLNIMSAVEFGYSVSEKVLQKIDFGDFEGKWGLQDILTRPPEDIEFQIDAYGRLTPNGVMQFGDYLPADKFVIYSHAQQFGNLYGNSDLRAAYRCYSDDTEILTEYGWKMLSAVTIEDRVATLNPKTDTLEYQYPSKLYAYRHQGKMFHQGGRFIDFLVTPNHEMWAKGENESKFRTIPVQDLPRHANYKRNARWIGVEPSTFDLPDFFVDQIVANQFGRYRERRNYQSMRHIPIESWLSFFGVWLAEGHTWQRKDGNKQRIVGITQNPGPKLELIKKWVTDCGFAYYEHKGTETHKASIIEICNVQLFEYLKRFGGSYDKFIPHELKQLSPRLLRILYDALMLGDGRHNREYCTVSRRLADDVAEIIFKMGYAATISVEKLKRFGPIFVIGRNERRIGNTRVNEHIDRREWIDYDGMVYCLEVPNHIVYVRRDGKAAWSRNSYWAKDNMLKLMAVSLERYAEPIAVATYKGLLDGDQRDDLQGFLKNLQSRSGIILPESVVLDFKSPPPRAAEAFIPAINLYDQHIRMAILMPGLIGLSGEQTTGSFARAVKEFDVFLWILGHLRKDIETVVNEQIIKPLIDMNYEVEHGQYPKFKFKEITEEARRAQFELFITGLGSGALTKGPEDEDKLRELIGFEPLPEDFEPPEQPSPFGNLPFGGPQPPEQQPPQFGGPPNGNGNGGWPPAEEEPVDEDEFQFSADQEARLVEFVNKMRSKTV